VAKKKPAGDSTNKLKPFVYEMVVEAIADNNETNLGQPLVSVCGTVLKSNFMELGARFCAPLAYPPIRNRVALKDKLRVTLYARAHDIKKLSDERIRFSASGLKYELWDDASEGWTCLYEKFENDQQDS
jgi:hypothetical protein